MKEAYLEFLFANFIRSADYDDAFGGTWVPQSEVSRINETAYRMAFDKYDFSTAPFDYIDLFENVFKEVVAGGGIVSEGDEFSGYWFKLNPPAKANIIKQILARNPAAQRLSALGEAAPVAFRNALRKIVYELSDSDGSIESEGELEADPRIEAPASDRLVTLTHNQISEFQQSVDTLVKELEADNGDPQFPGLRERLLGQLKAGRELILAGQVKAYLLYEVLVKALNELITKYGNETVKRLADALLGALVAQLFEGQ